MKIGRSYLQYVYLTKDSYPEYTVKSYKQASLVAQMVKNPPAMQEKWVQSLGQEDPLEKGTVTHSSILAWRIPRTEESGGLYSSRLLRIRYD